MDDLSLEILMATALLAVVLRSCWWGNPRPSLFVAAGGFAIAVLAAIRGLQMSDIMLPAFIAIVAGVIGGIAHKVPNKPKPQAK
jgi:hypothetical protein